MQRRAGTTSSDALHEAEGAFAHLSRWRHPYRFFYSSLTPAPSRRYGSPSLPRGIISIQVKLLALMALAATLWPAPRAAHAVCNLIPSATTTFRSTLGSASRPFAAPGEFVEIGVDTAGCDAASPGLGATAA